MKAVIVVVVLFSVLICTTLWEEFYASVSCDFAEFMHDI